MRLAAGARVDVGLIVSVDVGLTVTSECMPWCKLAACGGRYSHSWICSSAAAGFNDLGQVNR